MSSRKSGRRSPSLPTTPMVEWRPSRTTTANKRNRVLAPETPPAANLNALLGIGLDVQLVHMRSDVRGVREVTLRLVLGNTPMRVTIKLESTRKFSLISVPETHETARMYWTENRVNGVRTLVNKVYDLYLMNNAKNVVTDGIWMAIHAFFDNVDVYRRTHRFPLDPKFQNNATFVLVKDLPLNTQQLQNKLSGNGFRALTKNVHSNGFPVLDDSFLRTVMARKNSSLGQGGFGQVFALTLANAKTIDALEEFLAQLAYQQPSKQQRSRKDWVLGRSIAFKVQSGDVDLSQAMTETAVQITLHSQLGDIIPKVYASGFYKQTPSGKPLHVIFMHHIHGISLGEYVEKRGEITRGMFKQIQAAMHGMWRHGYAHADLNQKNIMVETNNQGGATGRIYIIDFGFGLRLPEFLKPQSNAHAGSREYQELLLAYLRQYYEHMGFTGPGNKAAPNIQTLRWLHTITGTQR